MGLIFFLEIFIIVLGISGGPPTTYQKFSRGDTVPLKLMPGYCIYIKVCTKEIRASSTFSFPSACPETSAVMTPGGGVGASSMLFNSVQSFNSFEILIFFLICLYMINRFPSV